MGGAVLSGCGGGAGTHYGNDRNGSSGGCQCCQGTTN
jgi:hypothetical protein